MNHSDNIVITRSTSLSRIAAVLALILIAVLLAAPFWGSTATLRLIGEMMIYLALASLWNLLAGYTGLVSVGQQAYVGLGVYIMVSVTIGVPSKSAWVELGPSRWKENPHRPASMPSCRRRFISLRSASLAGRLLAASRPIT